jgi:hypothetical protein
MQEVNSELEVFGVPEAIRLSFQHLDFIVNPFNHCSGNTVGKVVQYPKTMPKKRFCKIYN